MLDTGSGMKKYVARKANALLNRAGAFWQSENFDHWCRTSAEVERCVSYVKNNPFRAGLVRRPEDWPWVWVDRETFPDV
jgi:hypothetical protein